MNPEKEDSPKDEDDFIIGIRIDGMTDPEADKIAEHVQSANDILDPDITRDDKNPVTGSGQMILSELQTLREQVDILSAEFITKLKYDDHKNRIIDDLHQELQIFREGLVRKHIHSMVTDIIKIVDDIRKFTAHYQEQPHTEETAASLLDFIDQIASDLEDLFSWEGIVPFTCGQNTFDTMRQRIIKKIETDDPDKNRLIAESIRPGYEWDGKMIRPEMVSIYVFNDANMKDPIIDE